MDREQTILCVDDEPNILEAFKRQLRGKYNIEIASSGEKGLEWIKSGKRYSVVVSDMRMPEMDGAEFLNQVQKASPLTVRVMLTGNSDQATATEAVNHGQVYRFINKPCTGEEFEKVLNDSLEHFRLLSAEKELLQNTLSGSVRVLTEILSLSDPAAFGSGTALRQIVSSFASQLKLTNSWELEIAAMLSPIGWVLLPDAIKEKHRKSQPMLVAELEMIEKLPEYGSNLVRNIPRLDGASRNILYSNKYFDGRGFPFDNVKGIQIPEGARLLHIAKGVQLLESTGGNRVSVLKELKQDPGRYDIDIIQKLLEHAKDAVVSAVNLPEGHNITPKQLCIGQRLIKNLECKDGRLLLQAGTYISKLLYKSIVNYAESNSLKLPIVVDVLTPTRENENGE